MKLSCHQPNFLPYLGFFHKWKNSDVFVILDDAQFAKNRYINRNRIKTANGVQWLTVPVVQKGLHKQKICDANIDGHGWKNKMLRSVRHSYKNTPFFDRYFDELEYLIKISGKKLSEFNTTILIWLAIEFDINIPFVRSSKLKVNGKSTERIIRLCKKLGADKYLSGESGHKYHEDDLFVVSGIKVEYTAFEEPKYNQPYGDFEPNMSAIDFLFNCGPESGHMI